MLSCDLREYLDFWQKMFCYSTSVILLLLSSFFLPSFSFARFCGTTSSSRSSASALEGEHVSTFPLAVNKEWFFSAFSYLAWYIVLRFHTLAK